MSENLTVIEINGKTVYLLGTAHVSRDSAEEAARLIEEKKPDSVCVELDADRLNSMINEKSWKDTDITQVIKQKKAAFLLVNIILSSYQKRLAQKFGISVGEEMLASVKAAQGCGAQIVTADRSIRTTFMRVWRKMGFWAKIKLLYGLIVSFTEEEDITEEDLEQLKTQDMLEAAIGELSGEFPELKKYLVDERDDFLCDSIKNAPGKTVVAVVGAAHTVGIKQKIHSDAPCDTAELSSVPPPSPLSKIIGWSIPALIIGMMVYTLFKDPSLVLTQLKEWVLYNGVFAALFSVLSGAHVLSVITAFAAAPITSLNPLLAAGWFAGLVEAKVRKPTVGDFESFPEDLATIKGFFKNKVTKILIVVIAANIGSVIGTFMGGIGVFNIFKDLL